MTYHEITQNTKTHKNMYHSNGLSLLVGTGDHEHSSLAVAVVAVVVVSLRQWPVQISRADEVGCRNA